MATLTTLSKVNYTSSQMETPVNPNIVQPLVSPEEKSKLPLVFIVVAVVAVVLGAVSGFGLFKVSRTQGVTDSGKQLGVVKTETEEGVKDTAALADATGKLEINDGKVTTEGSHVLVRPGVSQNVYLTSSVVDMDKYVGKTVQVWGETFKGQKAGWLMDIGRIKIVN